MLAKMQKPDAVFCVVVNPVTRVCGCAEKQAEESRGLFGFHDFANCPDCQKAEEGYEMWGENGHMQGKVPTRAALAHWLRMNALKQWSMRDGGRMGYRFKRGGRLYYRG